MGKVKSGKEKHDVLSPYLHSVLKVSAISKSHDYSNPWDPPGFNSSWSGSAFALEYKNQKVIVTNAHVSGDSAQLMLRMSNSCKPYQARVLAVSHVSDLALLTVDDSSFWEQIKCYHLAVHTAEMPDVQDKVKVVGYPMGGQEMCVTSGKVNRIEIQSYCHSGVSLLAYQLDAAVNPGNSGGPVFYRDRIAGVAFMGINGADSINYFIPASVLEHFLEDVFYHNHGGFPDLNLEWQGLVNEHLRLSCKMTENQTGVLVKKIDPLSSAKGTLEKGDVLLEIDDYPICNDGTVNLPRPLRNRIRFSYLVNQKFIGDTVKVKVLRNGTTHDFEIVLTNCHRDTKKVGLKEFDKAGEYFVTSYLAFLPMTQNYLEDALGEEMGSLLKSDKPKKQEGDQYIILSHIFPHKDTYKYEKFANSHVKRVNGVKIRNMRQLVEHFDAWTESILTVELKDGDVIVVPFLSPRENRKFLRQFGIRSDRSENFRSTLYTAKKTKSLSKDDDDGSSSSEASDDSGSSSNEGNSSDENSCSDHSSDGELPDGMDPKMLGRLLAEQMFASLIQGKGPKMEIDRPATDGTDDDSENDSDFDGSSSGSGSESENEGSESESENEGSGSESDNEGSESESDGSKVLFPRLRKRVRPASATKAKAPPAKRKPLM